MEVYKILGINRVIHHCQLRNLCVPERETSFPVFPTVDPRRKLPNGCPCSSATSTAITQCLAQIPQSNQPLGGPPSTNNNCQSNVVDRIAMCCLSSTWRPQFIVAESLGPCVDGQWMSDGMGHMIYSCAAYKHSNNDWRASVVSHSDCDLFRFIADSCARG